MIEYLYYLCSILFFFLLNKVAKGEVILLNGKFKVFLYVFVVFLLSFVQYRFFISGEFLGVHIGDGAFFDMFSLVMFILYCIVPVTLLKRTLTNGLRS